MVDQVRLHLEGKGDLRPLVEREAAAVTNGKTFVKGDLVRPAFDIFNVYDDRGMMFARVSSEDVMVYLGPSKRSRNFSTVLWRDKIVDIVTGGIVRLTQ